MRATWIGLDHTDVADDIPTFKTGTLAKIEDLPGFRSASLMVSAIDQRAVTTVGYDDHSSLQYSREGASAVRDQAARQIDAHMLGADESNSCWPTCTFRRWSDRSLATCR